MSEKTKADKILSELDEIKSSYEKGLTDIQTALKSLSKVEPPAIPKPEHKHSANVEFDCPDCKKEYDGSVIKGYREKLKSMEHPTICKDCGEIVEEEEEECPTCHGKDARRVES